MLSPFKLIAMIHPMGDILVTVTQFNKVRALSVESGEILDTLTAEFGVVNCLESCASLPVFAFGSEYGIMYLYSVFNGTKFKQLSKFNLSDYAITEILMNYEATQFVALDESNGLFAIKVCKYSAFVNWKFDLITFLIGPSGQGIRDL